MLPAKWRSYAKRCLSSGVESEEAPTTLQMPANLPSTVMRLLFCRSLCVWSLLILSTVSLQTTSTVTCAPCVSFVSLHAISHVLSCASVCFFVRPSTSEEGVRPWKHNEANAFNRVVHVVCSRYMKFYRSKASDDIGAPARTIRCDFRGCKSGGVERRTRLRVIVRRRIKTPPTRIKPATTRIPRDTANRNVLRIPGYR